MKTENIIAIPSVPDREWPPRESPADVLALLAEAFLTGRARVQEKRRAEREQQSLSLPSKVEGAR